MSRTRLSNSSAMSYCSSRRDAFLHSLCQKRKFKVMTQYQEADIRLSRASEWSMDEDTPSPHFVQDMGIDHGR
jgi:hypothetical protein